MKAITQAPEQQTGKLDREIIMSQFNSEMMKAVHANSEAILSQEEKDRQWFAENPSRHFMCRAPNDFEKSGVFGNVKSIIRGKTFTGEVTEVYATDAIAPDLLDDTDYAIYVFLSIDNGGNPSGVAGQDK